MSKTYGVSDTYRGPWREGAQKPDQALAMGRAMWGNDRRIYVAEIAPVNVGEGLPSIEVLVGDVREKLVEKFGSGADAVFDLPKVMIVLDEWWRNIVEHKFADLVAEFGDDEEMMVAKKVKSYTQNQTVRVGDFSE